MPINTQVCKACKTEKNLKEFSFLCGKGRFHSYCKSCVKLRKKLWESNHKVRRREKNIKHKYDLSPQEYNTIFTQQEGKCAICGTHQINLNTNLVIDHDHYTKRVRGLVCNKCNTGLGQFNDDIVLLSKAIIYLNL